MKRILYMVIFTAIVFFLLISSSFASDLHEELKKRGLSPGIIERGISQSLGGGNLTVRDAGQSFSSAGGKLFDLVISKSGNGYRVVSTQQLAGLMFTGQVGKRSVAIFIPNGKGYVGIKTDGTFQLAKAEYQTASAPAVVKAGNAGIKFSNEVIQVPADIERR